MSLMVLPPQIDSLRKKLESLRELRELVRSLGRGGGKGPLKKAPEEASPAKSKHIVSVDKFHFGVAGAC